MACSVTRAPAGLRLAVREEIFGQVVCMSPFGNDDLDAIAKQANDTIYGLAANVWTPLKRCSTHRLSGNSALNRRRLPAG